MRLLILFLVVGLLGGALVQAPPLYKTPTEQLTCYMDFSQVVGADGTTFQSIQIVNSATQQDSTASILASSPIPAVLPGTNKVVYRVQGGNVGDSYNVSVFVADSTTGDVYQGVRLLFVTLVGAGGN